VLSFKDREKHSRNIENISFDCGCKELAGAGTVLYLYVYFILWIRDRKRVEWRRASFQLQLLFCPTQASVKFHGVALRLLYYIDGIIIVNYIG